MKKRAVKNEVGGAVIKRRHELEISQEKLAAVCQKNGWDISRDVIAKIELKTRCVTDIELKKLAKALGVDAKDLLI